MYTILLICLAISININAYHIKNNVRTLTTAYDIGYDVEFKRYNSGVYWEDREFPIKKKTPSEIIKNKYFKSDGECKEISNNNIKFILCTTEDDDEIKFTVEGSIKKPYMSMMSSIIKEPSDTYFNFDKLMSEDSDFTITLFMLISMLKASENNTYNINNNANKVVFDKKLNFLLVFLTIMFRGPENVE